jgi:hypothetical protein
MLVRASIGSGIKTSFALTPPLSKAGIRVPIRQAGDWHEKQCIGHTKRQFSKLFSKCPSPNPSSSFERKKNSMIRLTEGCGAPSCHPSSWATGTRGAPARVGRGAYSVGSSARAPARIDSTHTHARIDSLHAHVRVHAHTYTCISPKEKSSLQVITFN